MGSLEWIMIVIGLVYSLSIGALVQAAEQKEKMAIEQKETKSNTPASMKELALEKSLLEAQMQNIELQYRQQAMRNSVYQQLAAKLSVVESEINKRTAAEKKKGKNSEEKDPEK